MYRLTEKGRSFVCREWEQISRGTKKTSVKFEFLNDIGSGYSPLQIVLLDTIDSEIHPAEWVDSFLDKMVGEGFIEEVD